MSPPPAVIWHLHTPQVPPPPHAEGSITPAFDSVLSSVPPASVSIALSGSPLMVILTFPLGLSRVSAAITTRVRTTMTAGNTMTLPITTAMTFLLSEPFPRGCAATA